MLPGIWEQKQTGWQRAHVLTADKNFLSEKEKQAAQLLGCSLRILKMPSSPKVESYNRSCEPMRVARY